MPPCTSSFRSRMQTLSISITSAPLTSVFLTIPEQPSVTSFIFSSRRRHTRSYGDWSSDVCSSDLLLAKMNPIDQEGHQIEFVEFFLAQFLQLRRAGLHELPAHAGFFDSVPVHHAVHRATIVPRSQSRDDAFAHRSLPPSVVLQPCVAVQLHFLAFACAYPWALHRHLPSAKHHVTRLVSPAHRARHGIRPVRWSYTPRHLVFQNRADDAQPGLPGQLLHLGL